MNNLEVGDMAPALYGIDQDGRPVSLTDYAGQKLVLYFYPKDDTPGCTAEACSLRDEHDALQTAGYSVLGASPDSDAKHRKFITKHNLPFRLLADTDAAVARAYGAWGPKQFMGRSYEGILRSTFLIDENGKIERIITKVRTKDHATQILEELSK